MSGVSVRGIQFQVSNFKFLNVVSHEVPTLKIQEDSPAHLTYCLNVHPGETWEENFEAIRTVALKIRERVAPSRPFGLGLRLGHLAAKTLTDNETLKSFKIFLEENHLYVFTINGFPYGEFHKAPVKERVYRPDWRSPKRLKYTIQLADILSKLIPEGVSGSISTVPGSYKEWILTESDKTEMVHNLMTCVAHLAHIQEKTGKEIHLALEPEPDCFLETTEETVAFFTRDLHGEGKRYLAGLTGASETETDKMITRHLGVCFDTCHMSLQFENLSESISLLTKHGIRLSKIQISAALKTNCSDRALKRLQDFCDPVYLHQVKARKGNNEIRSYGDLPTALSFKDTLNRSGEEWRIHFHVPLYFPGNEDLKSTRTDIEPGFFEKAIACGCDHFEIETYTFDQFPENLTKKDLVQSFADEYEWVIDRMQ